MLSQYNVQTITYSIAAQLFVVPEHSKLFKALCNIVGACGLQV